MNKKKGGNPGRLNQTRRIFTSFDDDQDRALPQYKCSFSVSAVAACKIANVIAGFTHQQT